MRVGHWTTRFVYKTTHIHHVLAFFVNPLSQEDLFIVAPNRNEP